MGKLIIEVKTVDGQVLDSTTIESASLTDELLKTEVITVIDNINLVNKISVIGTKLVENFQNIKRLYKSK